MKYRQDIDGLRALAILAVVFYHMFPVTLPGGFTGVDIFFIISGYLIGSTILSEYDEKKFSFLKFYQRRLIRIIPLLLVVISVIGIGGYFLLTPNEFKSLGRHIAAASLFGSNFQLLKEVDYFGAAADTKPLLHLWSLGIEEQFYLILPLLLTFFGRKKWKSFILINLVLLLSFLYSCYLLSTKQEAAFFRPESRFWELLMGVALARFEKLKGGVHFPWRQGYGVLGLILCLFGIMTFSGKDAYPGLNALVPTLGASLIILSGSHGLVNRTLFSNPIMIFIGKISYSLYLWHWPLMSLTHMFYPESVPFNVTVQVMILAFLMSVATFYAVEKPLKFLSEEQKRFVSVFAFSGLLVGFSVGRMIYKEKIEQHFVNGKTKELMEASTQWVDFSKIAKTGEVYQTSYEKGSIITRGKGPFKIAFIGDSHSEQYYPVVERFVEKDDKKFTVYFLTRPGCSGLLEVKHRDTSKKGCHDFFRNGYDFLIKEKVNRVLFASFWGAYFTNKIDAYVEINNKRETLEKGEGYDTAMKNIGENIKMFSSKGIETFIIPSIPFGHEFQPISMFERRLSYPSFEVKFTKFDLNKFLQKYGHILSDIKSQAAANGGYVVDPISSLCNQKECEVVDLTGAPLYVDANHFRVPYSRNQLSFLNFLFL